MKNSTAPLALALAAALGMTAPAAIAQDSGGAAAEAQDFSEAKLASFVQAANAIQGVMADYRPQMESVETKEDREALRQDINDEIVAAVTAVEGITLDEYVEIARAAREDESLQSRIRGMMQES